MDLYEHDECEGTMHTGKIIAPFLFGGALAPWRQFDAVSDRMCNVASMISRDEVRFLYWLAREYYVGAGKIVDLGPLAGGSTRALAMGVLANPAISAVGKIIHSYDLWEFFPEWQRFLPGRELRRAADILPCFLDNIAEGQRLVEPHKGNLLCQHWIGEPIEILFVDIVKTTALAYKVARTFFPHLIPGRSVVVQQDFISICEVDVPLTMGVFRDHFEYVDSPEGGTVAFLYTKPIPDEMLKMDFLESLSIQEKLNVFDLALSRLQPDDTYVNTLMLAKSACLLRDGWGDAVFHAHEILRTCRPRIEKGEMVDAVLAQLDNLLFASLYNVMLGNQSVVDDSVPEAMTDDDIVALIERRTFAGKRVIVYGISDVAELILGRLLKMETASVELCDGYLQKIGSFTFGRQIRSIDAYEPSSYDIMIVCTKSVQSESGIMEYVVDRGHSPRKILRVYSTIKEKMVRRRIERFIPRTPQQSRAREILMNME